MDITLGSRDAVTGRFNFVLGADGDVSFDDTEAHAVMTSVAERRGSYWADPNHGSNLYTLSNITSRAPSLAEALAKDGVAALVRDGVIAGVTATASVRAPGALNTLSLKLAWTLPTGETQSEKVGV